MVHSGQTRIDVFHESVPAWGKVRFHCRFERAVYDWYRRHPRHISRAIRYALMKFRLAFDGGVFNLACCSRFLSRDDVGDKVEARIMLTVAHKDLLEKLAFVFRISQAEALRMVLEWNMEALSPKAPRDVFYAAREKWHHGCRNPRPEEMRFSFRSIGRVLEWQIPPPPAVVAACNAVKDPDTSRFYRR